MLFKESTLESYAAPLSDSEDKQCKHTIEMIRDALKEIGYTDDQCEVRLLESDTLAYAISMRNKFSVEKIHIFIQGSYANNTCVKHESDVDIAVVREDVNESAFGENLNFFNVTNREKAIILKNKVEDILNKKFPYQVSRGNKSIKVKGNTYRKNADAVPCLSMKYYNKTFLGDYSTHHEGIVIFADDGTRTINFPKQHIANGKKKNNSTKFYYKRMVRIIKNIRNVMQTAGYKSSNNVSSFGLESLVWNVPDTYFTKYLCYGFVFEDVVSYLYRNTDRLMEYYEANGIKKLCSTQYDVDRYRAFIDDLYLFFQYDCRN